MDKALLKSNWNKFSKTIAANEASKFDCVSNSYICLHCGEKVFLCQGEINKHCFSHHKAEKNNECDLRIQQQFTNVSSSKLDISDIKKWLNQIADKRLEYVPQIPSSIFEDKATWHSIVDVLINEINLGDRFSKEKFKEELSSVSDLDMSSVTRFMIDNENKSENELIEFYWEIYLRFRLLYRLYGTAKRKNADGYYKILFSYFDNNIHKVTTKKTLVPFSICFDSDKKSFQCFQFEKDKPKRNIDFLSPDKLQFLNPTQEITQLKDNKYLITIYDTFNNVYTSTNNQVPIGTTVLIVGELGILHNMIPRLNNFSNDDVFIIKNIAGLSSSWGIIEMELINPQNMPLSECPNWIAWRYLELIGGLKIKDEVKRYMVSCPPVVILNGNIPSPLIEIKNSNNEVVEFTRNNNNITIGDITIGSYSVQIKGTPYSIDFSIGTTTLKELLNPINLTGQSQLI